MYKGRGGVGSIFRDFVRTSFMDDPLVLIPFFLLRNFKISLCAAVSQEKF